MGKRSSNRQSVDVALTLCEVTALGCSMDYPGASSHDVALLMSMRGEWMPRPCRMIEMVAKRCRKGREVLEGLRRRGLVERIDGEFTCSIYRVTAEGRRVYKKNYKVCDE